MDAGQLEETNDSVETSMADGANIANVEVCHWQDVRVTVKGNKVSMAGVLSKVKLVYQDIKVRFIIILGFAFIAAVYLTLPEVFVL